jgi:predicted NBD/HSP70 family sugar kinase
LADLARPIPDGQQGTGKSSADDWVNALGRGIAYAVYSASAVTGCEAVIVDGSIPPFQRRGIVDALKDHLARFDAAAAERLVIREGTRDRKAIALGAACLPLVDRFFPQPAADA